MHCTIFLNEHSVVCRWFLHLLSFCHLKFQNLLARCHAETVRNLEQRDWILLLKLGDQIFVAYSSLLCFYRDVVLHESLIVLKLAQVSLQGIDE